MSPPRLLVGESERMRAAKQQTAGAGAGPETMHGVEPGKRLLGTRPVETAGVRAVRALFENANYTFQEVDRAIDIGKDAYVDLQTPGGVFAGAMIAVQIKSGTSFRHGENYKIDCDANDRAVWAGSTVPVYGMVYDPGDGTIHWANLTAWARTLTREQPSSYCPVLREHLLSEILLQGWSAVVRGELEAQLNPPVLDLASGDGARQRAAVGSCFALGRRDARALILLRASLRWLVDVDGTFPAIGLLAMMTPMPHVAWTSKNWIPQEIREEVRMTFRWSVEETELLIAAPPGSAWDRGDIGQCVYYLLDADPDCEAKLEEVVAHTHDDDVRYHAAMVRVAFADEAGLEVLDRMIAVSPALGDYELIPDLRQHLELESK